MPSIHALDTAACMKQT